MNPSIKPQPGETPEEARRRWSRFEAAALLVSKTALTELGPDDAIKIVSRMRGRRVDAGTVLIQEGFSNSDYMMLILEGQVAVQSEFARRNDAIILAQLGQGQFVGELGMMDDEPRSATCIATTDCELAILDRKGLLDLIELEPKVACNLLASMAKRLAQRVRNSTRQLRTLTQVNRSLLLELDTLREATAHAALPVPAATGTGPKPLTGGSFLFTD
jgi:CRP-like cAMP-binding protein